MKVFHYSSLYSYKSIRKGKPNWLIPQRSLVSQRLCENQAAIFGLLSPNPPEWVKNKVFRRVWSILKWELKSSTGGLLLEVDIKWEEDSVFVVDRGHMEWFLHIGAPEEKHIPEKYRHKDERTAAQAYVRSAIPLNSFIKEKPDFSLPEVIIHRQVPSDRIRIAWDQPLIREILEYENPREGWNNWIHEIPELTDWYKKWKKNRLKKKK